MAEKTNHPANATAGPQTKHSEQTTSSVAVHETTEAAVAKTVAKAESDAEKPGPLEQRSTEPRSVEPKPVEPRPVEHGGPKGLEPTRYGDWEKNGRCTDF